jgi:hypothetical protein
VVCRASTQLAQRTCLQAVLVLALVLVLVLFHTVP